MGVGKVVQYRSKTDDEQDAHEDYSSDSLVVYLVIKHAPDCIPDCETLTNCALMRLAVPRSA